jgi:hypothetical protein
MFCPAPGGACGWVALGCGIAASAASFEAEFDGGHEKESRPGDLFALTGRRTDSTRLAGVSGGAPSCIVFPTLHRCAVRRPGCVSGGSVPLLDALPPSLLFGGQLASVSTSPS